MTASTELPDTLLPLAWLIGEWHGEGHGEYPTIAGFEYREQTTFALARPGKPVLAYSQRTWLQADGAPSHTEAGYLRAVPGGRAELVIAQPTGVVEVHVGTVESSVIELATTMVGCAPTAKLVTQVRRVLQHHAPDTLWYRLDMAAVGEGLLSHCEATLRRVNP